MVLVVSLSVFGPASRGAAAETTVLDPFEDLSGWSAVASPGAEVEIAQDTGETGFGMRIDFDFHSRHGFVIARKEVALELPENYTFSFRIRGQAPPNDLEFKLVDRSGKRVWRRILRAFELPVDWESIRIKKSRIDFAWGPDSDELDEIGAIEIAIAAGAGGKGSVWIDDLRLEARPPSVAVTAPFDVRVSTSLAEDGDPADMLDGDPTTRWRSGTLSSDQWALIDLGRSREYGGLIIDWDAEDFATVYEVQTSDDGEQWAAAYRSSRGNGRRDYVYLPDGESRYLRLAFEQSSRGQGYAIAELKLQPVRFSSSINRFFEAIAAEAPPGMYPKYLLRRQTLWTVIGVAGDAHEALINEEGMIEAGRRSFAIEPFLHGPDGLVTWDDVEISQSLADGYLPIPSVAWTRPGLAMTVTAFAGGEPGASVLYATYVVRNTTESPLTVRLFLAVRPFQVSPPWQALNMIGGAAPVRDLELDGHTVRVNGEHEIVGLVPPDRFGAVAFEQGAISEHLRSGQVPSETWVHDPFGYASGALEYVLEIEPKGEREIAIAVPFHRRDDLPAIAAGAGGALAQVRAERERVAERWRTVLGRVELDLPPDADALVETLKSTLAYIEINRDGPAIQPGSRAYERSWIRDGALTSTALLQMGFISQVRDFLEWFSAYQDPDGRIPCCVDRRGADPVVEHDSSGGLIHAVMEYYRFTRDVGFLSDMWPRVVRAVEYIDALRSQRMTVEYEAEDKRGYYGILPESISHEGYSSHPVHSYWDDFLALRGLRDAAEMAGVVGDERRAREFASQYEDFRARIRASIEHTMEAHDIDFVPGSVELGDFDPTSTAIAVITGEAPGAVPEEALHETFEQYWKYFRQRRAGEMDWRGYTAYELRNVQALIRLGYRGRAVEALRWLVADQRPGAWRQWPEISWRDRTAPGFIGDLPHTWVASAFVSSLRTMLAYERDTDHALVLAAGVPREWLDREQGIGVKRLPTHYGVLGYRMRREPLADGERTRVRVEISGDLVVPAGGIEIRSPLVRELRSVTINGRPAASFGAHAVKIAEFPAEVVLGY